MTKADLLKYIDERLTQRSDGNIGLLMVRQYVADNMEDYHAQNLKAYAHDFNCTIEEAEKALRKEQPTQKNESNTLEALDCVSRKAAIDAIGDVHPLDYNAIAIRDRIKALPSANQWIPCSERLPEDGDYVIVTVWEGCVMIAWRYHNEWETESFSLDDGEVNAWMPLPEPWKGEEGSR